jgi:excisionase family DNA binding protein
MKQFDQESREDHALPGPLRPEEYLSVRDVASRMGVSPRSVYAYIEAGKLPGVRIGASLAVHVDALRGYQRPVVGRKRTRTPVWRAPVVRNRQYLTTITVYLRQGREKKLEQRLRAIHREHRHTLPGTVARYIARSQVNPARVQIVLLWRRLVMPPEEEREAALAALSTELADVLDWETASSAEWLVLMHA